MRRFKLTKAAKLLIMVVVLAVIGGAAFAGVKTGFVKTGAEKAETTIDTTKDETVVVSNDAPTYDENGNVMNIEKTDDNTINLSLDEWIG